MRLLFLARDIPFVGSAALRSRLARSSSLEPRRSARIGALVAAFLGFMARRTRSMRSPTRANCANMASAVLRLSVQVLLAGLGDAVELARAVGLHGGVADLFEIGEGGIHHAGAGHIEALGALVQRLDDFVAVAGFSASSRKISSCRSTEASLRPMPKARPPMPPPSMKP